MNTKPKRRWLRYRLPSLLLFMTITSAGLRLALGQYQPVDLFKGKTIEQWVQLLGAEDELSPDATRESRQKAAEAIVEVGAKAIPALAKALQNPDSPVELRRSAVMALEYFGPEAKPVIPTLAGALRDPDSKVRYEASNALGKIGKPAVPLLMEALQDLAPEVHQAAYSALWVMGKDASDAVPFITAQLQSPTVLNSFDVKRFLKRMGPPAVPPLIELLDGDDSIASVAAAEILAEFQSVPKSALAPLSRGLQQADPERRFVCAAALCRMTQDPAALDTFCRALKDQNEDIRLLAVERIGSLIAINPAFALPALQPLIEAAGDRDRFVRREAISSLGAFGKHARPAIPVIGAALKSNDLDVQLSAVSALGEIGPDAAPFATAMAACLKTQEAHDRWIVVNALEKLGASATVIIPALIDALNDDHVDIDAVRALAKFGPQAKDAIPALIKGLSDKDHFLRLGCAYTLAEIGPVGKAAIDELARTLQHDADHNVRMASVEAIQKIDPRAPVAVLALIAAIKDEDGSVRSMALAAIEKLGQDGKPALPVLREVLNGDDSDDQCAAARALWRIVGSEEGIPVLLDAIKRKTEELSFVGAIGHSHQRLSAAVILHEMGRKEVAVTTCIDVLLQEQEFNTVSRAAGDLVKFNDRSDRVMDALRQAMGKRRRLFELEALWSIRRISLANALWQLASSEDALLVLCDELHHGDRSSRVMAIDSLGKIGPRAKVAVAMLRELLDDIDWDIRKAAERALQQIDPASSK